MILKRLIIVTNKIYPSIRAHYLVKTIKSEKQNVVDEGGNKNKYNATRAKQSKADHVIKGKGVRQ
jgi:hypothetical protein